MAVTINGTTGIANDGGYTGDGVVFADTTPANTLVTTTGGNVGIGTSSPATKLEVTGDITQTWAASADRFVGSKFSTTYELGLHFIEASRETRIVSKAADSSGLVSFYTGVTPTERARIDSSGNLLVGTTSVAGSAVATFVKTATAANQRVLHLTNTGAAGSNSPAGLNIQYTNASSGNGSTYIECYDSNSTRFLVLGSGNVQNANNSYGGISDAKLKENVTDATPKLGKLNQVRVVNYNLIGETQKQIGVIAQELEQIFPGMVEEMPDRDAEGNDLGTTTKSVKYSVFVPMLIKAIQEQQVIITALTARVTALEGA